MQEINMSETASEVGSLAQLMIEARQNRARFYEERLRLSNSEAYALAAKPAPREEIAQIANTPVEQIDWSQLDRVMEASPKQGLALWQKIKESARDQLRSGHRAAIVIDGDGNPWTRACFCAVRDSFVEGWKPRNSIEQALIDTLAQAYVLREFWLERLNILSTTIGKETKNQVLKTGKWEPPLASTQEALDQAELLVDRFDRLFQRNLRSLRDLRRYAPVVIQNAGQVNIAQQQVNAAQVTK